MSFQLRKYLKEIITRAFDCQITDEKKIATSPNFISKKNHILRIDNIDLF